MSKLSTAIAFFAGAALGGAAVWYVTKDRYARLAEEEINSVKEVYAQRERERAETPDKPAGEAEDTGASKTPAVTAKVLEKESISEYAKRVKEGAPMDYSRTIVPHKADASAEPSQSENSVERPYVISPEEFNELDGYTPVSLTYFSDGVLADEYGAIVDDVEEIIGDGLDHFGDYEDDSVFVRNDAKRCDYEILRDERTYAEFRKTLPTNI